MQNNEDYRYLQNIITNFIAMTKHRIIQFLEKEKISKTKFFQITGIKRGFLDTDKLNQAVSDEHLTKIIAAFPTLNLYWLVTGESEMYQKNDRLETIKYFFEEKVETLIRENERLKIEIEQLKKELARMQLDATASAQPAVSA